MMKWLGLLLAVLFSGNGWAEDKGSTLTFQRTEVTSPLKIGSRPRVTPYTMIYARIQPYDLYGYYLEEWIDRPLYHNREFRDSAAGQLNAFRRDMEAAKEYEIEGFTMLANAYATRYKTALDWVKQSKIQNFSFMSGIAWSTGIPYSRYLETVKLAAGSPHTLWIDGKIPLFSYVSIPEKNFREIRNRLAADGFSNVLLFDDIWLDVFAEYNRTGKLSDSTLQKTGQAIRKKLNYADGLILANFHMDRDPQGEYTLKRRFYPELDKKYIAPLMEKIYKEPENRKKLLGVNIRHGYIGHMSGINEAELGTSQLREAMDTALLMNPDILSLVEWNEVNENTSFQPTVANSRALQRLIRFYARLLKGLPATPNPGDDTTIPNLLVSVRQTVKLGEKYRIELLHIPDTTDKGAYTVELSLKNQSGKVLHTFAADRFQYNQLTAVTYQVPSEELADHQAVIPELKIIYKGKELNFDTLPCTRLNASEGWNFKEIRQPLRDLATPVTIDFQTEALGKSRYRVRGKLKATEPLASVEILDGEREVWALDRENRFAPEKYHLLRIQFSAKKDALHPVTLSVPGVTDFLYQPWGRPYAGFGRWKKQGDHVTGNLLFWKNGSSMLLGIPKNAVDAVIKLDIQGVGAAQLAVKELLEKKRYACELAGQTQVKYSVQETLGDHPVHWNRPEASFDTVITAQRPQPCFQLRVITVSGKIWRSKPVFPEQEGVQKEQFNVFSASKHKVVTLQVPSSRITAIDYRFKPDYGNWLTDAASRMQDAGLGGGFQYLYPMCFGSLPKNTKTTAPEWHREGTDWILQFDGIANYLVFPVDAFPTGPFTLEFEAKTDSAANQALFRHAALDQSSLDTYIVDGYLRASFAGMGVNFNSRYYELPVKLPFPSGHWNRVKISYDLEKMIFSVNGQTRSVPFARRAAEAAAAIFGGIIGNDKNAGKYHLNFFNGKLRSLKIRHNAEP